MIGSKNDQGKLRYDLIRPETIRALAEVMTQGAQIYGDRNWEDGISFDRLYAAMMRHVEAYRMGENIDLDSGYHHLAHALCNMSFIHYLYGLGKPDPQERPEDEPRGDRPCGQPETKDKNVPCPDSLNRPYQDPYIYPHGCPIRGNDAWVTEQAREDAKLIDNKRKVVYNNGGINTNIRSVGY